MNRDSILGFTLMILSGAVVCAAFSWLVLIGFGLGIVQVIGAAIFLGGPRDD
jgi:hypothetical protein